MTSHNLNSNFTEALYWALRDLKDPTLSLLQKHILFIITTTLGQNGFCRYGTKSLMELCQIRNRTHFIQNRDVLIQKGYLILIKKGGEGRKDGEANCNFYSINFYKIIGKNKIPFDLLMPTHQISSRFFKMKRKVAASYLNQKVRCAQRTPVQESKVRSAHSSPGLTLSKNGQIYPSKVRSAHLTLEVNKLFDFAYPDLLKNYPHSAFKDQEMHYNFCKSKVRSAHPKILSLQGEYFFLNEGERDARRGRLSLPLNRPKRSNKGEEKEEKLFPAGIDISELEKQFEEALKKLDREKDNR
jgi:hypothetical protein